MSTDQILIKDFTYDKMYYNDLFLKGLSFNKTFFYLKPDETVEKFSNQEKMIESIDVSQLETKTLKEYIFSLEGRSLIQFHLTKAYQDAELFSLCRKRSLNYISPSNYIDFTSKELIYYIFPEVEKEITKYESYIKNYNCFDYVCIFLISKYFENFFYVDPDLCPSHKMSKSNVADKLVNIDIFREDWLSFFFSKKFSEEHTLIQKFIDDGLALDDFFVATLKQKYAYTIYHNDLSFDFCKTHGAPYKTIIYVDKVTEDLYKKFENEKSSFLVIEDNETLYRGLYENDELYVDIITPIDNIDELYIDAIKMIKPSLNK